MSVLDPRRHRSSTARARPRGAPTCSCATDASPRSRPELTADGHARVIDADGLHVAPGFIDTHSHSDLRVLVEPDLPMKVMQGITLDVLGQDGISVAPVRDDDVGAGAQAARWPARRPRRCRATGASVADYLALLDRGAGHQPRVPGAARRGARRRDGPRRAQARRRPSSSAWSALVARAMDEGALGLSTGLIYPPCCYADTDELVALCTAVAQARRASSSCTCARSPITSSLRSTR